MKLNRDGTVDVEETHITEIRYENRDLSVGGQYQRVELLVETCGEFRRDVSVSVTETETVTGALATVLVMPPEVALKLGKALIRGWIRARKEQARMARKQRRSDRK